MKALYQPIHAPIIFYLPSFQFEYQYPLFYPTALRIYIHVNPYRYVNSFICGSTSYQPEIFNPRGNSLSRKYSCIIVLLFCYKSILDYKEKHVNFRHCSNKKLNTLLLHRVHHIPRNPQLN